MASRGRGRGRGRGGGFTTFAAQVEFHLFPEVPIGALPDPKETVNDLDANTIKLLKWGTRFQNYWKASPYLLEDDNLKGNKRMHIPRYSDRNRTVFTRDSLSQVLMFNEFPKELVQGTSKRMPSRKKFRWNPENELKKKIEFFEQRENRVKGREDDDEKEKKEGENEDEDENAEEEEAEEDFSDDDYNQNEYFDDDEDDYNDANDGDDEPVY